MVILLYPKKITIVIFYSRLAKVQNVQKKIYIYIYFPFQQIGKLKIEALLVTDQPCAGSTTRQNPTIFNQPLYSVVTFYLIMRLTNPFGFRMSKFCQRCNLLAEAAAVF